MSHHSTRATSSLTRSLILSLAHTHADITHAARTLSLTAHTYPHGHIADSHDGESVSRSCGGDGVTGDSGGSRHDSVGRSGGDGADDSGDSGGEMTER